MSAPVPSAEAVASAAADTASVSVQGSHADMSRYGTHEATCDGCNVRPIVGFRYKCTKVGATTDQTAAAQGRLDADRDAQDTVSPHAVLL
jgi:hypothetical protein